jgi:hypothetical protein
MGVDGGGERTLRSPAMSKSPDSPYNNKSGVTMSLAIEVSRVFAVLLSDGKWYQVEKSSFEIHPFLEFSSNEEANEQTATFSGTGGATSGFRFLSATNTDMINIFYGPMSAIQAVQERDF